MFTNTSGAIAQIKAEVQRKSRYGVIGKNHYYPFGMPARPKSYGAGSNQGWIANPTPPYAYKYNGKELNVDFGLNLVIMGHGGMMRGWEIHYSRPTAEKMRRHSPYNYALIIR
ncbi:MAG: hypothetical protein IPF93_00265 [Saprospiraceae bacterium]|nr:hypothetical protein [Saprospiraceae bacterium]